MLQPEEDASLAEAESAASFVRSMAVFFATTLLSLEIVMTLADATADAPPSVQRMGGSSRRATPRAHRRPRRRRLLAARLPLRA